MKKKNADFIKKGDFLREKVIFFKEKGKFKNENMKSFPKIPIKKNEKSFISWFYIKIR